MVNKKEILDFISDELKQISSSHEELMNIDPSKIPVTEQIRMVQKITANFDKLKILIVLQDKINNLKDYETLIKNKLIEFDKEEKEIRKYHSYTYGNGSQNILDEELLQLNRKRKQLVEILECEQ